MGYKNNLEEQEEQLQLIQNSGKRNLNPKQKCNLRKNPNLLGVLFVCVLCSFQIKAGSGKTHSDLQYSVTVLL